MHIYFSGIGGTGIGPLALVAKQAGFSISGSDKQDSDYIAYLRKQGINNIHIGQDTKSIEKVNQENSINWLVYTSALTKENKNPAELEFCRINNIKYSKRDELLNYILRAHSLKLIAIAGTHGKTSTTGMTIWALKQLNIPISYILPAKSSFAEMGHFDNKSDFFVYECDEYDKNFLNFMPHLSLISGIDYDHPDIYPSRTDYYEAFKEFIGQSRDSYIWNDDAIKIGQSRNATNIHCLDENSKNIKDISLIGHVNRKNAWLVANALSSIAKKDVSEIINLLTKYPGVSRRFEQIIPNLYSDYAHTPPKIKGAIEIAQEATKRKLIVVYEGLHNTRQHFIKDELKELFTGVDELYVAPSYLAREDPSLKLLSPSDLINLMSDSIKAKAKAVDKNSNLKDIIKNHIDSGNTVLCLTAGGGGSLDEWLRQEFKAH